MLSDVTSDVSGSVTSKDKYLKELGR
jgi:hypothetical protein